MQQDAYVERLFDDESWTVPPVVEEAGVVALLEAHLRSPMAALTDDYVLVVLQPASTSLASASRLGRAGCRYDR